MESVILRRNGQNRRRHKNSAHDQDRSLPKCGRIWAPGKTSPGSVSRRGEEALFRQAERNGRLAAEALFRCRRYVDGWLAHADPATGLIPRNLRESRDFWNGRDAAADNYPFMVLTSAITDRALFEGRMLDMLRTETRLTARVGPAAGRLLLLEARLGGASKLDLDADHLRRRRVREGRPDPADRMARARARGRSA